MPRGKTNLSLYDMQMSEQGSPIVEFVLPSPEPDEKASSPMMVEETGTPQKSSTKEVIEDFSDRLEQRGLKLSQCF